MKFWLIIAVVVGFIIFAFYSMVTTKERYMQDCLRDGRPEYECAAMIYYGGRNGN